MGDVTIREAVAGDLPGVLRLYAQLQPDDPVLEPDRAETLFAELLAAPQTTVLVAEIDGALVASCTLTMVPNLTRNGRPYGVIENVVTDEGHRLQGLGKAVLAHAVAIADRANAYKVMLATGSKRESTLVFYESAGFARDTKTYFEFSRR